MYIHVRCMVDYCVKLLSPTVYIRWAMVYFGRPILGCCRTSKWQRVDEPSMHAGREPRSCRCQGIHVRKSTRIVTPMTLTCSTCTLCPFWKQWALGSSARQASSNFTWILFSWKLFSLFQWETCTLSSFTVLMLEEPTGRHNWRILLGVGVKLGMEIICNHNVYDNTPSHTLALYIALVPPHRMSHQRIYILIMIIV